MKWRKLAPVSIKYLHIVRSVRQSFEGRCEINPNYPFAGATNSPPTSNQASAVVCKTAERGSVIHCKLTIRNKTYNFVHIVSKLCDKCYKLLNESVLSGFALQEGAALRQRQIPPLAHPPRAERINYNGHFRNGDGDGIVSEVN